MSDTNSLPFELTDQSISAWLSQLDLSNVFLSASELYKVLSALKKQHKAIDSSCLALAAQALTPVAMQLSGSLAKMIIRYPQERSIAQISTRILCDMSFLLAYLAKQADNQTDQVQSINYAMQILGVALQHAALSYERPPEMLWKCVSECYALTIENRLMDRAVDMPLTEFQALPTISLALKRLLLFSLTNPYQFSQKDILSLFNFCTNNSSLLAFVDQGVSLNHVFFWDYTANNSFQPVYTRPEKPPNNFVNFHAQTLLRSDQKKALAIEGAGLLFSGLSHYRDFLQSTKFAFSKSYVFASEFEQVVMFFNQHVSESQQLSINVPTPKELNFASLELIKKKENKFVLDRVLSKDIWDYNQETKQVEFGAMNLQKTDQPLFFVAETMKVRLVSGQIFICFDIGLKLVLGITRSIELKHRWTVQRSVVELCKGKVSILQSAKHADNLTAVLLTDESRHELFLAKGNLRLGSVLTFDQLEVVLERVIELSPYFVRYVVLVRELKRIGG